MEMVGGGGIFLLQLLSVTCLSEAAILRLLVNSYSELMLAVSAVSVNGEAGTGLLDIRHTNVRK